MEERHTFDVPDGFTYRGYAVTEITAKPPKLTMIYEGQGLVGSFSQLQFGFSEKAGNPRVEDPYPDELVHPNDLSPESDDEDPDVAESRNVYQTLRDIGIAVIDS